MRKPIVDVEGPARRTRSQNLPARRLEIISPSSSEESSTTERETNTSAPPIASGLQRGSYVDDRASTGPGAQVHHLPNLYLAIDYGTTVSTAAWCISHPDDKCRLDSIYNVRFTGEGGNTFEWPMIATWIHDEFVWGEVLERQIEDDELSESQLEYVIILWKLALYPSQKHGEIAMKVQQQLNHLGKTLDELLVSSLKGLFSSAKSLIEDITRNQGILKSFGCRFEDLEMHTRITVPVMWTPRKTRMMQLAARRADIPRVRLVYEPQAAAAFIFQRSIDMFRTFQMPVGNHRPLNMDDFVSYRLLKPSEEGAETHLKAVGKPEGALCGSEHVNQNFVKWISSSSEPSGRTRQEAANDCGLTLSNYKTKARAQFERKKKEYNCTSKRSDLLIIGPKGTSQMTIDRDRMISFFDDVINDKFAAIDRQLHWNNNSTKVILLTGGFGRSSYLVQRLRDRYQQHTQNRPAIRVDASLYDTQSEQTLFPVSRGAISKIKYRDVTLGSLSNRFSFGIARREDFDKKVHKDGLRKGKGKQLVINYDIVKNDPIDKGRDVVEDRITWLVKRGGETFRSNDEWTEYGLEVDATEIVADIYWTELDEPQDHMPAYVFVEQEKGPAKVLTPGIQRLDKVAMQLPNLRSYGYVPKIDDHGQEYLHIWSRQILVCDGANMDLFLEIAKPSEQPYDDLGRRKDMKVAHTGWVKEYHHKLWDKSHSQFVVE
ncbi:hypothetical protein LTR50_004530 [Elasticomyces elasticus]|nr:hypothetical protein LTR50_004530 [Elasticomyces elasticus]